MNISPISIDSAEAFGSHTIGNGKVVIASAIASAEALGTATLNKKPVIGMFGIVSAEAFGTPMLGLRLTGIAAGDVGVPIVRQDNLVLSGRLVKSTRGPITVEIV